jgi:adenylate cyclase
MTAADTGVYRFGTFVLDLRRGCLHQGDTEIKLRPKSYAVLRHLATNAGRLVGKDELIETVWPSVVVTDESVARCVSDVRQALGDTRQELIRTVPRRGYLLVTHRVLQLSATGRGGSTACLSSPPGKPSIAVLPFANLNGDPGQDHFADGTAEEIITSLSRISWLCVVARSLSFACKGRTADVAQVGRELGARYVVDGSVRQSGDRVRISVQLVDSVGGTHLWADRFDGAVDDIFDLQDRVAIAVAGVIEPALQAAEIARMAGRQPSDLGAHDLFLRADAMMNSSAALFPQALALLLQAIERDPNYGPALSLAAVCCLRMVQNGQSTDRRADNLRGADFARKALRSAPDDPITLANAALALTFVGEEIEAMMGLVDRALALNPSYARGWYISSMLKGWAGQHDAAIDDMNKSLQLNPRLRIGVAVYVLFGSAHLFSRRFDEAAANLGLALQEDPNYPTAYRFLAACYAHMGRFKEAREAIERLRGVSAAIFPPYPMFRRQSDRELLLSGLRLAIGQETMAPAVA